MLPVRVLNRAHAHALAAMSAEDDEDAAEYASELLVGRVAELLGGQDVDASVLTEGLLLRRELVEEWVGGGTPLALLLKGGLLEEAGARVRVPGAVVRRAAALAPPSRGGGTSSSPWAGQLRGAPPALAPSKPAPQLRRAAVHGLAAPRRSQTRGGRRGGRLSEPRHKLAGGGDTAQLTSFCFLLFVLLVCPGRGRASEKVMGTRGAPLALAAARCGRSAAQPGARSCRPTRGEPALARRNHGTREREKALTSHGKPSEYNRAQPSTSNARTQAAELRLAEMRGAPRLPRCRRRVITAACGLDVTAHVPTPADRRKRGARPRGAPQAEASRAAARWPAAAHGEQRADLSTSWRPVERPVRPAWCRSAHAGTCDGRGAAGRLSTAVLKGLGRPKGRAICARARARPGGPTRDAAELPAARLLDTSSEATPCTASGPFGGPWAPRAGRPYSNASARPRPVESRDRRFC